MTMAVSIVTGSAGLIGSEACRHFAALGMDVVGIDNDLRSHFFGSEGSTEWQRLALQKELGRRYQHHLVDIRDEDAIEQLFRHYGSAIQLVVHAAAQPSHDWASRNPKMDFSVNATGTLNLLEATRQYAESAAFVYTSTNKVYGDNPNRLPLAEHSWRFEIDPAHRYSAGISEDMSVDQSLHSLFGASKVAADILVQEYGRYFGLRTGCFRGGCLTGPSHSGAQLHGFLSYLVRCTVTGTPYTIFGYAGKQVRDNIHSVDLINAFDHFFRSPRCGEVYNIGGGRFSNCSILEAIEICQGIAGRQLDWTYSERHRRGDHIWWISDFSKFQQHYPNWKPAYDVRAICQEIYDVNVDRWTVRRAA